MYAAKSVGRLLRYQDRTPDAFGQAQTQLMVLMLRELVSLTAAIHADTSGLLQQPSMNLVATLHWTVLVPIGINPPLPHHHQVLFCDTGSADNFQHIFYGDDPLWDGAGCGPNNNCCDLNNPPWFRKQLPSTTTDNIEMRFCREAAPNEDTPIGHACVL